MSFVILSMRAHNVNNSRQFWAPEHLSVIFHSRLLYIGLNNLGDKKRLEFGAKESRKSDALGQKETTKSGKKDGLGQKIRKSTESWNKIRHMKNFKNHCLNFVFNLRKKLKPPYSLF